MASIAVLTILTASAQLLDAIGPATEPVSAFADPVRRPLLEERHTNQQHLPQAQQPTEKPMPFLAHASAQAQQEFYAIVHNERSRAEIQREVHDWSRRHELEKEVKFYEDERARQTRERDANVTRAIAALPHAYNAYLAIRRDGTLSQAQERAKIRQLLDGYDGDLRRLLGTAAVLPPSVVLRDSSRVSPLYNGVRNTGSSPLFHSIVPPAAPTTFTAHHPTPAPTHA